MNIGHFRCGLRAIVLLLVAFSAPAAQFLVVQPVDAGVSTVTQSFNSLLSNEENYAIKIFGQIGLNIDFLPAIADASVPANYDGTNPNEPNYFLNSTSFETLPTLTVWFVGSITNQGAADRGLTYQPFTFKTGVWIASSAVNDTLAHEIGNALYYGHETSGTPSHLMDVGAYPNGSPDRSIPISLSQIYVGSNFDQITSTEEQRMLGNNAFVQSVPEPPCSCLALAAAAVIAGRSMVSGRYFRT